MLYLYYLYDSGSLTFFILSSFLLAFSPLFLHSPNFPSSLSDTDKQFNCNALTTPGDRTNMRGVRVFESSITAFMSRTGGSTNLK